MGGHISEWMRGNEVNRVTTECTVDIRLWKPRIG